MSKEEALKIQTCVLKVNIHCDGCQKKVKKILHKIEGVYQTRIDVEQGKVTVSGTADAATIIKKLNKAGKPAELWGSKAGVANQFQKLHLDGGGKGRAKDASCEGQKGGGGGGGGGGSKDAKMVLPQLSPQQLQQMQMKGLKLPPQFMDLKTPFAAAAPMKDPKSVKFNLPEDDVGDDGGSEFDDDLDDFDDDDEGLDDDFYDDPKMMMKPMAMPPNTCGGDKKGGNGIGNGGKKGGGGNEIPVQIKGIANNGGGGKKDAGGKQNQGGGGGKNGGGGQPNNAKGGAPSGGNHPGQGKKGGGGPTVGVGGPMAGMTQQQAMMRRNMNCRFPRYGPDGWAYGPPPHGERAGWWRCRAVGGVLPGRRRRQHAIRARDSAGYRGGGEPHGAAAVHGIDAAAAADDDEWAWPRLRPWPPQPRWCRRGGLPTDGLRVRPAADAVSVPNATSPASRTLQLLQ